MSALAVTSEMTHTVEKPVTTAPVLQRKVTDNLSSTQRQQINAFKSVFQFIHTLVVAKDSWNQRVIAFQQAYEAPLLTPDVLDALKVLQGKKFGKCPDRATLFRWKKDLDSYLNGEAMALTKAYKGRQRTVHGWEQKAIQLFNLPSKPGYADVAFWLRTEHGFESATKDRVTRYLRTMPETLGKQSPMRMGKQFYKHNLSPYIIRDNTVVPVGYEFEGDGHTVDVYIAHPSNEKSLFRPELTLWIDVRSAFVTGWYLSEGESSISTLFALSEAILVHDHVPAMVHPDNGCGFKSRMMTDEVSGFFNRLSITPSFALPGNAKSKGLCEGFFKIFRNRHDKKFLTYCGDDMAPEINRRLSVEVKNGKRSLPSYISYVESVRQYIDDYNNEPKGSLNGKSPREVWEADLQQVRVHIEADALVRPRTVRTVRKWRIRLDNRFYEAAELAHYNNREVMIEYSLHHDSEVRILDEQERLICVARLVSKTARLPESRMVEAQEKRLAGQEKRLNNKIIEMQSRAKPVLSVDDSLAALEDLPDADMNQIPASDDDELFDYLPDSPTNDTSVSDDDWLDDL